MTPQPVGTSRETTLVELVMLGVRSWPLLLAGGVVFGAMGFVASRFLPSKYKTTALLQIDTQSRRPSGALGEMADLFQSDARAETETELIQSRAVIETVVDSLGLDNQAVSKAIARRLTGTAGRMDVAALRIPMSTKKSWSAVVLSDSTILLMDTAKVQVLQARIGEWTQVATGTDTVGIRFDSLAAEPGEVFTLRKLPRAELIASLQKSLKVAERGRKTGILELSFTANYPDRSRDILNSIAQSYVRQNIDQRSAEARKALDYLKQQMPSVRAHLDSLENLLKSYRAEKGTIDIGSEAQVALREQTDLQQQLLTLQQLRQELLRLYSESHPTVTSLDAQIRQVRGAL
ncbi:MAG TPA: Wzz/FepE/Etk N-terminal domain-containing protein, partial [Fibrobacteria bacterium]|nr:Wzz/FepE/Etk N-terminal domain-containing protein [Fibrobacteria bacterium]